MEAERPLSAQEERRRKLLEYLAAKEKLKPQNNQKPYLRDTTNLQNKRQPPLPKQVYEKKKDFPITGKSDTNKNKTLSHGPLQNRLESRKISAQQNVSSNRSANRVLAKKPVINQNAARTNSKNIVQCKTVDYKDKLPANEAQRGEQQEIGLTVVLSKIQHGDKTRISDVHVMDQSLSSSKGLSETKQMKYIQTTGPGKGPQKLQRGPVMTSVNKPRQMQALKAKPALHVTNSSAGKPVTKSNPPVSKPVPATNSGHIRIVSRVSQPASKNGTATERSFLIKSFRGNGAPPKQQQTVNTEPVKSRAYKPSCTTKLNPVSHSAPLSVTIQKNVGSELTSTTKAGKYSSSHTTKKSFDVQSCRSISKPAVWQMSTGPVVYNKTARPQVSSSYRAKGTNSKATLTSTTCQSTGKAAPSDFNSNPHTPKMTVEDRRKKLQEWLSSKGKTYKRPPLILPPKRPTTAKKKPDPNPSVWQGIEEEEELLLLSEKISQTLGDCLELIDKGVSAEDIHAALDKVPEGKKFAKYWICKAKLLEREGNFDVVDVHKQGVQCGAEPIDELRDVVFNIMKNTNKKSKVVTFGPLPFGDTAEEEQKDTRWHATPAKEPIDNTDTPGFTKEMCDQGSSVKFQVACVSSKKTKRDGSSQEWKCLTPVRRSLRIHQSASQYPDVVQEHNTVVTCLDELLDMADTEAYLYVRNEALPEEADQAILDMVKQDSLEGQHENPV